MNEDVKKALEWYEELAASLARYSSATPANTTAMLAVVTTLSLDGGLRARNALASLQKDTK